MPLRVLVSFRATFGPGRTFPERATVLAAKMTALGGDHVGFDALKLAFAFDASRLTDVLEAVPDAVGDELPWAVGIAEGAVAVIENEGSALLARGMLAWGPSLVAASALADLAQPGEILVAETVRAIAAGELVTSGFRIARDGTWRVRGLRIERRQPWKRAALANVARMTTPPLVRAEWPKVAIAPGALVVVRADPGAGGTRFLNDVAASVPRALVVGPSGSGFAPLGALRRALARSLGREVHPLLLELSGSLDALLAGKAVSLDAAAKLIKAVLWPRQEGMHGALLVDDAKAIDPATLEACVRAVSETTSFALVARLDCTGGLPSVLAALPKAAEYELPPLSETAAEEVAGGATGGALDAEGRKRWARLGGGNPLTIVESLTTAIASGDVIWTDTASPRARSSGRGEVRPAMKWIRQRANAASKPARAVLSLLAVLGGEARVSFLARAIEKAELSFDVDAALSELERARWIVTDEIATGAASGTRERTVALPTRSHHKALFATLEEDARRKLHRAAAQVLLEDEGVFGCVEAAWHAVQAGETAKVSGVLLEAARATADARLEASTTQLIAFARRTDPSCEEAALELLAGALDRAPSNAPPPKLTSPPETARTDAAPEASLPPRSPRAMLVLDDAVTPEPGGTTGSPISARLGEVAKEALLAADNAVVEKWVDGLRAAGESPAFTDRMRAMARLGRGDIGDALRVLRRTRSQLEPEDHRRRCQTSLALGVALSVAGRPQEALLEGMDALARARQDSDARGAKACLAFLAKLYTSVSRDADADRLRSAE